MKQLLIAFLGLTAAIGSAKADRAEARFQAFEGQSIQVIVNGKLINELPISMVKVKEKPGSHQVTVKVFNRYGRVQWVHQERIVVKAGYINSYTVSYHSRHGTQLRKKRTRPVHVDRYRRPDKFYNKRNFAIIQENTTTGFKGSAEMKFKVQGLTENLV